MPSFSAFAPNPVNELAQAISGAVAGAPEQQARMQAIGMQMLQPYKAAAQANPALRRDPNFIGKVTAISKRFGLPLPMQGQGALDAVSPGGSMPVGAQNATPATAQPQQRGGTARVEDGQAPGTTVVKPAAGFFQPPGSAGALNFGQPGSTPPAPAQPQGGQQPAASTQATPGEPPAGVESFMRPATQGPSRIDLNAWLGRNLSIGDFSMLSQMDPTQRQQALKAQGYDLTDFDSKWLQSPASLTPDEKIRAANDAATRVQQLIKSGAPISDIRATMSLFSGSLTPDQLGAVNTQLSSQMTDENRARFMQIAQTGVFRQGTIDHWMRQDTERQTYDQNRTSYEYALLHDRDAHFAQSIDMQHQRLGVELQRVGLDQQRLQDQEQNQQFAQTGVRTGQMVSLAKQLLGQIQSESNEINRRVVDGLKGKKVAAGQGVSDAMMQSYNSDVQAYNALVQGLQQRGGATGNIFQPWTDADTNPVTSNLAGKTAANAVTAQGTPPTSSSVPGWDAAASTKHFIGSREIRAVNGKWVYQDGSPAQ